MHSTVPPPPPPPPEVNETEDIVLDQPLEESVFTVTLTLPVVDVPGGVIESYTIFLEALGESTEELRKRRQINEFLDDCIIEGINNNFTVSPDTTELDVNASKLLKCVLF